MLWGVLGGVAFMLLVVAWAITVHDIMGRRLARGHTAGWLLIVFLLPFVGSALWWALRKPTPDELEYQAESQLAVREQARRRRFDSTGIGP